MHKSILLFFAVFISYNVQAQILNIEKMRLEKDTAKVFLVKATLALNANNRSAADKDPVHLFSYEFDVNTVFYPGDHAYIFVSKLDYLQLNKQGVLNYGYFHGRSNFLRESKVNYETFVQYSFDALRGLDPRWVFGGAVRLNMINSDKTTFVVGVGGMYEYEKWKYPRSRETIEASLFKSSNYLSLQKTLNSYLDLNLISYYQVGYDKTIDAFRNRISGSVVLNAKITERFSLTNSFDLAYEDKPLVPITKFIYTLKTGLSINF